MASAGEYGASVRMMISYGGAIVQADGKAAYYAGGVHRIVKIGLSERLPDLRARLAALVGCADVFIRYALPGEGLERLRDVANDGDLWGLVSLLFCHEVSKTGRIRVFLFDVNTPPPQAPAAAAPLRSASSPALPALVEEGDRTAASGGACATPVAHGIPRSASSPSLPATPGGACEGTAVRMKVSYGGEMIQRDVSAASYYAGGIHRIIRVGLSERLADLGPRLAALAGCSDVRIRYALPGKGLGHLRDVASDCDLWSLVSLLFFHEAVTSSEPKQGRIRVFLFGADAPATSALVSSLRRSASSPLLATSSPADGMVGGKHHGVSSSQALSTLVEENEDHEDDDTAAATPTAGGGVSLSRARVTVGMRRSVSSPAMATSSSLGSDAVASTSASRDSGAPASDDDTPATAPAMPFAPVVLVPVMPAMAVYPVIPVYAIRVVP